MILVSEKIQTDTPLAAVSEVFSKLENPSILGGNECPCPSSRFSTWSAEPAEIFTAGANDENIFEKLKSALNKYKLDTTATPLPPGMFPCGWIGYFSYDLGRRIEKIPENTTDDLNLPLIRLCFYDKALCFDRAENTWWAIALGDSARDKISYLRGLLKKAAKIKPETPPPGDLAAVDVSQINCNASKNYYMRTLDKIRDYIYNGEVYQINYSQRFDCPFSAGPIKLYHWQNTCNPSPYAAFIKAADHAIVSASPEMFITIEDDSIATKPIKGTRRRYTGGKPDEAVNKANFAELVESEKDQAELNMIIDLERNDLTRICRYGTIKVTQPRTIETYPTVFHAVSTIAGKLCKSYDFCDILKAMFPGGSITGAPKIRSMEIIEELEPTRRSVYTGSIGFIGVDGTTSLNIAIRTVIIKNKTAYIQTGGGIVADSNPKEEYEETITKARALLAGIKAVNN